MENIALTLENVTGKGLGFKLKDISAKFENGYIYAITGKNGAGKTTLFNYILAQRKQYTGSIKMSGYELERNHSKAIERENREIRRREKVIQIFPNTESIIRLIGAVLQDDHNEWSVGHKIFDMKEYYDKLSSIQSNLLKIKVA